MPMPLLVNKIIRIRMNEMKSYATSTPSKANINIHIRAHVLRSSCRIVVLFKEKSLLMLRWALP